MYDANKKNKKEIYMRRFRKERLWSGGKKRKKKDVREESEAIERVEKKWRANTKDLGIRRNESQGRQKYGWLGYCGSARQSFIMIIIRVLSPQDSFFRPPLSSNLFLTLSRLSS